MRKIFEFTIKEHKIKITNAWFSGMKLYVDGNFCDQDSTLFASGKAVLLSSNLGKYGILEILPRSTFFSVQLDALLNKNEEKQLVFSSYKRLSLKEQSLAK